MTDNGAADHWAGIAMLKDGEINKLKAERDKALAAFIQQCGDVDRLRAALEAACSALEYNDENEAYGILREARRALRQNEPEK